MLPATRSTGRVVRMKTRITHYLWLHKLGVLVSLPPRLATWQQTLMTASSCRAVPCRAVPCRRAILIGMASSCGIMIPG